jgi:uncharacterized protein (TIGR02118 family)
MAKLMVLLAGLLAVPLAAPPAHGLTLGRDFAADVGPPAIRSSLTSQPHSDRIAPPDAGGLGGHPTTWRTAMIKVSVMYANTPGARFDHEYYRDKHMPLVKKRLGDACLYYTVDKGLAGGAPGAPATYVGMCHIFCDSVESFQAGFGPHAKEIMADIPNYTDLTPVIQISEVVVERA